MKKFKEEKGITLVALIITIVVLLILAVVAIGTVRDSDIIGYAQNAAGGYNQAKDNEITILQDSEQLIEENIPKAEDDGITVNKLLNKAYTNNFNATTITAYYLKENEGKIYLDAKLYDITTGEDVTNLETTMGAIELNLTSEFEAINITVNGSPIEISSENAFFDQNSNYIYFTEDAMYIGITDGGTYTTPCEYIYARNSNYDSKINN